MGSCMILFVKGTKRAQQVMEAQPVFLFKPELLFYFSKGMSKSRGDVFSPTRTVQSHLANQVCLFRQGHRVVAENTQTCPWHFLEWKGAEGVRQKSHKRRSRTPPFISPLLAQNHHPWPLHLWQQWCRSTAWQDPPSPSDAAQIITLLPFPIPRGGS